jgi:hypothetical protein
MTPLRVHVRQKDEVKPTTKVPRNQENRIPIIGCPW